MRKTKMERIEINGTSYPIRCDMNVLEEIQDERGISISQFEREMIGAVILRDEEGKPQINDDMTLKLIKGNPKIKTLMMALELFINEGLAIEAEEKGTKLKRVTESDLRRECDMSPEELSGILHKEFARCVAVKKKTSGQER